MSSFLIHGMIILKIIVPDKHPAASHIPFWNNHVHNAAASGPVFPE